MNATLTRPAATLARTDDLLAAARALTRGLKRRGDEAAAATAELVAAALGYTASVAGLEAAARRVAREAASSADALAKALEGHEPAPAAPPADRSEAVSHALNGVTAGIAPDALTRQAADPPPDEEDEEEESDVEGETGNPVGSHPAEQRPRAEPDGVGELGDDYGREWPERPLAAREADPAVVDWICGDDEPLGVPAANAQTQAESDAEGETGNPVGSHPAEQPPRAEGDGVGELAAREWPEVPLPEPVLPAVPPLIGVPAANATTQAEGATKPKRRTRKR